MEDCDELVDTLSIPMTCDSESDDSGSTCDSAADDEIDALSLADQLSTWSVDFKISHMALNRLLLILKPLCPTLPKDARILLQTSQHTEVKALGNGSYTFILDWQMGLTKLSMAA
jgi:hypothetical protein